MTMAEARADRIMSVKQAAALASVTEADILHWIDARGLKATPIGSIGRRGPRRYLILESWLLANIEAHAVTAARGPAPAPDAARDAGPAPKAPRRSADLDSPLGPRPRGAKA
jgi:hypothetical protein